MTYSLQAVDNPLKGDSGGMSMIWRVVDGKREYEHNAKPRVGWVIRVGSMGGRSFCHQDWWQTSTVLEILEERDDYVKFRTRSTVYEWKEFNGMLRMMGVVA